MESNGYRKFIATEIRKRIIDCQYQGVKTSKGEKMSYSAIARAMDPPVSRVAVHLVVNGQAESRRIKAAVEQQLNRAYWIRKDAA